MGKTVILITHKLEEIKKVADRCGILNRGKLVDILDVASTTTKTMANLMVGREIDMEPVKKSEAYGETVLQVVDLRAKNVNGVEAVRGVSFSVRAGEIFAIAGVSGNGQDEIAGAITGLGKIDSGRIYLKGVDITNASIRSRNTAGISHIPGDRQTYGLILEFDLANNLVLKNYFSEPFSKGGVMDKAAVEDFRRD